LNALSKRKTRTEQILAKLEDDIARGRLAPGATLDEVGLAERFGVSRTPIREAIRQLEAFGFADARPRRGAVVSAITDRRLDEMFLVMAEMEGLCAKTAALEMQGDEKEALQAVHDECRQAAANGEIETYYALNLRFHEAIYTGAHNSFLEELTRHVRKRVAPYRRAQFHETDRLDLSYKEHDQVVQAILGGDAETAHRAMTDHMRIVRTAVRSMG
jgi:DNA-binding GntR family transcriptional regulator